METTTRRVIASTFVSLDGVMEAPMWSLPYWNDAIAAYKRDELFAAGALLLGRVTYEEFAAAWASRTSDDGFAERMNSLPKYVATTTLSQADLDQTGWHGQHLGGDVVASIQALKQTSGGDLLIGGSARLIQSLTAHDLIDEYRLLVYPIVLGEGKKLFGSETATLELIETQAFGSGVMALTYRPARPLAK